MSPRPMVFVVENRRNQRFGRMTRFWSSRGQAALGLQHALDHEHDVGTARVVFVKDQGDWALQRPGQDALAELGDLLAVLQDNGVLADQVDAADVAVQVHADQRPVQPGGDLFDVGRLAGAVIALNHDAAVKGEAGADGERRLRIEAVALVDLGGRGCRACRRRARSCRNRRRTPPSPSPCGAVPA